MTDSHYPPSLNPASRSDFSGLIRFILTKALQKTDDMLPATVVSYNRATNRAAVQPLVSIVDTNNNLIQRGVIASVPVFQLGGGGFVISCPIKAGDLGWIKANDRDISLFLKAYQNSQPNTARLHSFEDGLFIPDTMFKNVQISGEDANNLVIQNTGGTVKISWGSDSITMTPQVGIGGSPRTGAILDMQTTSHALGIPAMSSTQKSSIASPQTGYTVFDTTEGHLSTYNGSTWS